MSKSSQIPIVGIALKFSARLAIALTGFGLIGYGAMYQSTNRAVLWGFFIVGALIATAPILISSHRERKK